MIYIIHPKNVLNNLNEEPEYLNIKIEPPKTCPRCNCAWQPIYAYSTYRDCDNDSLDCVYLVGVVWVCPNCNEISLSEYSADGFEGELMCSFPYKTPDVNFYKGIKEISPSFIKIYKEALSAEYCNLLELSGMGYRKALEFLVKDYAISKNPNNKESIAKTDLSVCIKDYIANPRAEAVMERTAWIGNDQTHYVKLHNNMDLEDLKALLDLSLSYITMELQTDEAMKIPKKKR